MPVRPKIELDTIEPMVAIKRDAIPSAGSWEFEIKYDGYRILACTDQARLRSRKGTDATAWFEEVVEAIGRLPPGNIMDGEVTVLDRAGRSDFDRLQKRARRRGYRAGDPTVVYCVFDLLVSNGIDIRDQPIEDRKEALRQLIGTDGNRRLLFVSSIDDGPFLLQHVLSLQLEGMVAKRAGSLYRGGPSYDWIKIIRPGAARGFRRDI